MANESFTPRQTGKASGTGPELAFIIVNWNGGDFVRRAVESISLYPPRVPFEIIIVDNGSSDSSLDGLRSAAAEPRPDGTKLRLIENRANRGFGAANNQAFEATSARLLFLLNADAELGPGACDTLIAALDSDPRTGLCGPRIVNPDGSLQVSVWRNPPTAWAILATGLGLHKLLPRRLRGELFLAEHWAHDRRREVAMLGAAALLVRRRAIEQAGGFDERFHMYGEDNEWCLRVRRAGWRLLFEPAATIVHHGAQSSSQRWTEAERMRVQLEALFRFQDISLKPRQRLANLVARSLVLALHVKRRQLLGRPAKDLELVLQLYREELGRLFSGRAARASTGPGAVEPALESEERPAATIDLKDE